MQIGDDFRIGIDLGGTKIEAILLDRDGIERARRRIATPASAGYDATIGAIRGLVDELEAEFAIRPPAPVGIGMPGAISPATGLVKNANSVFLNGRPFDRDVAAALGRPVRVANDADCLAVSEATDGAGAGADSVFAAILGTGVGGGLVVAGRPLRGPNAVAGEWGHNPLPWPLDSERPGPACYCGRQGCIETFLSGPGLARDLARHDPRGLDGPAIVAAAESGDPAAAAALDRYVDRLARALATVINLFDPHAIVLGGGLSRIDRLYTDVPARWGDYVFSDRVTTPLRPARFGDSSGVRGAAWLWPRQDR
ncbi:fructokinase [Stella humosa]|uniref:Fructokinase n=1 Tax=Stella humosa TaxID=94 RepID=A0A3N1KS19_9PROT|nr:ROK family protein [Stella humosa]ROP81190.1 fructokinase [Stella humosa]BBK32536.1 N-acetylglucosamine kinase [Stella humosa]